MYFNQDILIVRIPSDCLESDVVALGQKVGTEIRSRPCRGLLFDLMALEAIDTATFNRLRSVEMACRVTSLPVVWVSIGPGLAASLIDLDVSLDALHCARDVQSGINAINTLASRSAHAS